MKVNNTYAFYSTPSRVWELFAGSIVYLIFNKLSYNKFDSYLSIIGITIVAYTLLFLKDSNLTSGFISLTTVIGTSLYILFTKEGSLIYKVMSCKYFVFIGVISYSLYLYHQPVLVFYRIGFNDIGGVVFILLFLISALLACISYKVFEDPIRRSKSKIKYLILLLPLTLIVLFINRADHTNGYIQRYSESVLNAQKYFITEEYRALTDKKGDSCNQREPKNACYFEKPGRGLIVIGDSFAGVFTRSLNEINNLTLRSFQYEQCPLLSKAIWFGNIPNCWEINKARWIELGKLPPTNILVGTNFYQFNSAKKSIDIFKDGDFNSSVSISTKETFLSFRQSIEKLIQLGHHPIILLQTPDPNQDVAKELQRKINGGDFLLVEEYTGTNTKGLDQQVYIALNGLNVDFININKKMCNEDGRCLTFNKYGGLYNQDNHLSYFGVQLFIEEIIEKLQ